MNVGATQEGRARARGRMRAARLSLAVGTLILAAKLGAWWVTGSAAILSDALESIVNVVAAAMALFSVWYGSQPADEDHPYGHGKIEDFSAGVEGALILIAALLILWSAVPRFFDPRPLQSLGTGALLVAGATLANLLLGLHLVREGRRNHSRALIADGQHVLADVVTSLGAIAALVAVRLTGLLWLDPLLACVIAVHIVVAGFRLIRDSVSRLMDQADTDVLDRLASELESRRLDHWIDVHELRAWWAGDTAHVDAHVVLPRYWSIDQAHSAGDEVAEAISSSMDAKVSVVIHTDPCRERHCRFCRVSDCGVRAHERTRDRPWHRDLLIRRVEE